MREDRNSRLRPQQDASSRAACSATGRGPVEETQGVGLADDLDTVSCLGQFDRLTHLGRGPAIHASTRRVSRQGSRFGSMTNPTDTGGENPTIRDVRPPPTLL